MSDTFREQEPLSVNLGSGSNDTHTIASPKPKMSKLKKVEEGIIVTITDEATQEVKADLDYVTLIVGDSREAIKVHTEVLCASSSFFKAACKSEWMKVDNRVIELPEDDPEVVKAMVYWLYKGKICTTEDSLTRPWSYDDADISRPLKTAIGLIIQLYVAGDKYDMPKLQSAAIDATSICQWHTKIALHNAAKTRWIAASWPREQLAKACVKNSQKHVHLMLIPYVYQNTFSRESSLRKLMVTMTLDVVKEQQLLLLKDTIEDCGEFFFDLSIALLGQREHMLRNNSQASNLSVLSDLNICRPSHGEDEIHQKGRNFCVNTAGEIRSPFIEYERAHILNKKEIKSETIARISEVSAD